VVAGAWLGSGGEWLREQVGRRPNWPQLQEIRGCVSFPYMGEQRQSAETIKNIANDTLSVLIPWCWGETRRM